MRLPLKAPPPQDWRQQVAQLIPLLFLCLIMFGNSGSLYDPPFSLKRTAKFRHERLTRSRGVVPDIRYYVADGFSAKHARDAAAGNKDYTINVYDSAGHGFMNVGYEPYANETAKDEGFQKIGARMERVAR